MRRPERGGDGAVLFDLFAAAHGEALAAIDLSLRDMLLRQQFAGQNASHRALHPDGRFEIVERDGAPVGRLVTDRRVDAVTLVDIALLPDWRGRGIGTHLLRALQDEARVSGVPLVLSVLASNAGARRLYGRLGFVPACADRDLHLTLRWTP